MQEFFARKKTSIATNVVTNVLYWRKKSNLSHFETKIHSCCFRKYVPYTHTKSSCIFHFIVVFSFCFWILVENGQMVRVIDSGKCGMVVANNNDGRYVVKLDKDPNVVALLPSEFEVNLCSLTFSGWTWFWADATKHANHAETWWVSKKIRKENDFETNFFFRLSKNMGKNPTFGTDEPTPLPIPGQRNVPSPRRTGKRLYTSKWIFTAVVLTFFWPKNQQVAARDFFSPKIGYFTFKIFIFTCKINVLYVKNAFDDKLF